MLISERTSDICNNHVSILEDKIYEGERVSSFLQDEYFPGWEDEGV